MSIPLKPRFAWQNALANLITDPEELWTLLELDKSLLDRAKEVSKVFPLRVPRSWVACMQKANMNDPLLKQIVPLDAELQKAAHYQKDPLNESAVNPIPGLLHKYKDRVLVTLTGACAIHCRYCFRRYFPYAENTPGRAGWEKIMRYIADNAAIHEVILSGGDPLTVNDELLSQFTYALAQIPHLKRFRIHTRLPVVLPERITTPFLDWLTQLKWPTVMVIHSNHPQEMSPTVRMALVQLRATGILLLNQSVLLKGINDQAATLIELSETLFAAGVLPYYLHLLDKVEGTQHFDVPFKQVKKLQADLLKALPGYLVPKFVYEEAGGKSKTPLFIDYLRSNKD